MAMTRDRRVLLAAGITVGICVLIAVWPTGKRQVETFATTPPEAASVAAKPATPAKPATTTRLSDRAASATAQALDAVSVKTLAPASAATAVTRGAMQQVAAASTSDTAAMESGAIPMKGSLAMYLTVLEGPLPYALPGKTDAATGASPPTTPTFDLASSRWYNYMPNEASKMNYMMLNGWTADPYRLNTAGKRTGVALKNLKFTGIQSIDYGETPNALYSVLTSFTLGVYVQWNALTDLANDLVLFRMYAETPDRIECRLRRHASDGQKVTMVMVVGDWTREYGLNEWHLQKASLITGRPVLISVVFTKDAQPTPSLELYVGDTLVSKLFTPKEARFSDVRLGNSMTEFNLNANVDGNALAIVYYRTAFNTTMVQALRAYFDNRHEFADLTDQMNGLLAVYDTLLEDSANNLNSQAMMCAADMESLKKQLASRSTASAGASKKGLKYQVAYVEPGKGAAVPELDLTNSNPMVSYVTNANQAVMYTAASKFTLPVPLNVNAQSSAGKPFTPTLKAVTAGVLAKSGGSGGSARQPGALAQKAREVFGGKTAPPAPASTAPTTSPAGPAKKGTTTAAVSAALAKKGA